VLSLADAGLTEMRALIFELRPESLEVEGLVAALTKQAAALRARHGVEIRESLASEPAISLGAKEALYRVAQEALHNVVKHARATRVDLLLETSPTEVRLEVRDDGLGFDPAGSFPGHLGLHTMRDRAVRLGGSVDVESAPGQGTLVRARIPAGTG
jgi:signal transduction histidine kinase